MVRLAQLQAARHQPRDYAAALIDVEDARAIFFANPEGAITRIERNALWVYAIGIGREHLAASRVVRGLVTAGERQPGNQSTVRREPNGDTLGDAQSVSRALEFYDAGDARRLEKRHRFLTSNLDVPVRSAVD